ncbi:hypothetical protein [Phyllobacterium endophyticum]|uniref:hypothetical protein n=1 Tax=Phyllobacterium endophyticum TaxID=1149773 RepID=UPI0011C8F76B|nr:hypothetical protein [Phyllobacterium endophyticum]TXR46300.1 hypothetical protein FVA77_25795 [Phyllobacterium endophyticum]
MTKKGHPRTPAEVFRRGSRRKEFSEHVQSGHKLVETDERLKELLKRLEEAEEKQTCTPGEPHIDLLNDVW